MNKKGFTLIELISTIVILSLILIIIIPVMNSLSRAMKISQRNNLIEELEVNGARYAFDSGETLFLVEDLLMYGYMDTEKNSVENPVDNTTLNCYALKATKTGDYYKVSFLEQDYANTDGTCNRKLLKDDNSEIQFKILDTNNVALSNIEDNSWIRMPENKTIRLKATFTTPNVVCGDFISNTSNRCVWSSSTGKSVVGYDYIDVPVKSDKLINVRYNFQLTIFSTSTSKIVNKSIALKIDNQKPEFSNLNSKYDSTTKTYRIIATDGMGSGIAGYYLGSTTSNCNSVTYQESNVINNVNKGNYKACIKDKVGNILEVNVTI